LEKFDSAKLSFSPGGGLTGRWQAVYRATVILTRLEISGTKATGAAYKIMRAQDGSISSRHSGGGCERKRKS
jgi:hypothetical protein